MTNLIGLITPPKTRLTPLSPDEILAGQHIMDALSKDHGFKPGTVRGKATASFTKALTAKCITTLARRYGRDTMVASVESYDSARGRSADLFGIVDLLCIECDPPRTRYIQACGKDWQPHITKMADYDHINATRRILANPSNTLELWGWQQYDRIKSDGTPGRQKFWLPRVQLITLDFLLGHSPPQMVQFFEASMPEVFTDD